MGILEVLITSALPFSELRGGIPLALLLGYNPLEAYVIAVAGNLLPVPILIYFLNDLVGIAERVPPLWRIYRAIVGRVERKKEFVEKYGYIALTLFVAIPLPVTGAWTGSLIAFLLGLEKKKAIAFISLGVSIAGVVVLLASLGVIGFAEMLTKNFS